MQLNEARDAAVPDRNLLTALRLPNDPTEIVVRVVTSLQHFQPAHVGFQHAAIPDGSGAHGARPTQELRRLFP
jgi:hypothetical protein